MLEGNVISIIGQTYGALLYRMLQYLIHPGDIGSHGYHGCQILQSALKRIVKARDDENKQEERQDIQAALYQEY